METNETCPAEQEWHNKLLMEKERKGGKGAEREGREATGRKSNKELPLRTA